MTKEEVEQAFNGASPYYAYMQGVQDGMAYTEESFRREAAKDILASIISGDKLHCPLSCEEASNVAIQYADALIAKLKEK